MREKDKYCECDSGETSGLPEPLFRLICHCKTCQEYYGEAFNDECTYFFKDCNKLDLNRIEFKNYQSQLSPLKRGKCKSCGKVAYSIAGKDSKPFLVTFPSAKVKRENLPEPVAHVYYDRRVEDSSDPVRKVSGHMFSQFVIQWQIFKSLFGMRKKPNKKVV